MPEEHVKNTKKPISLEWAFEHLGLSSKVSLFLQRRDRSDTNLGWCTAIWRQQHAGVGPLPSGPPEQNHRAGTSSGKTRRLCPVGEGRGCGHAPSRPGDLSLL